MPKRQLNKDSKSPRKGKKFTAPPLFEDGGSDIENIPPAQLEFDLIAMEEEMLRDRCRTSCVDYFGGVSDWLAVSPCRDEADDMFADLDFESVPVQEDSKKEEEDQELRTTTPKFKLPVPVLSVRPPVSSEDSASDKVSISSFRVPSINMGRESVGDIESLDGDCNYSSYNEEIGSNCSRLSKRGRSESVDNIPEEEEEPIEVGEDDRDPTKLYEGTFDVTTRATNFLVTFNRVHIPLSEILANCGLPLIVDYSRDVDLERKKEITMQLAEAYGTLEWKRENGFNISPHVHLVFVYAENMKPMVGDVLSHACRIGRINPFYMNTVNVVPLTRFRAGLKYITKFLKGGVKGLFDPNISKCISIKMFTHNEGDQKSEKQCPRAGVSRNTLNPYEQAKKHAFTAARLVMNENQSGDGEGYSDKKKKKVKLDIAAMGPSELWEALYEFPEISSWEEITHDVESVAAWITAIFTKLQEIGRVTRTDLADKVLIMLSTKGFDVNKLLGAINIHTSIRTSLADKRKGLSYSMFMPGRDHKFPNIDELVSKFKTRYANMINRIIEATIEKHGRTREQVLADPKLKAIAKRLDSEMCEKGKIFLWLKKVVKYHSTGKVKRNRHLFIHGGGTNGKTAFKKFLEENFLVQYHSATHSFLTTVPDQRPCHIYIFEEFDIMQHLGKDAKFRLNMFNSMLGEESRDMNEYRRILNNLESWPGPNVKSHVNCRTNPFVFYVFYTNSPIPKPCMVRREDEPLLENFLRRLDLIIHLDYKQFLPDEVCSFVPGGDKTVPLHEKSIKDIQKSMKKKLGFTPLLNDPDPDGERFGYDEDIPTFNL